MKKIACLFAIGLSLISCSLDKTNLENSALVGRWNWVSSTGGIDGATSTPQTTGKSIKLEISNTKVKKYINGVLVFESNYWIQNGTSIYGGRQKIIIYENNPNESFYITNNNQLILKEECFDCYQKTYSKETSGSN